MFSGNRNIPIVRLPINSHRCCYNDCTVKNGLKVMPKKKRAEILRDYKLFISKRASLCAIHMAIEWSTSRHHGIDNFSEAQLKEIMDLLSCKINPPPETIVKKFNVSDYDIGISPDNFEKLLSCLHHLRCQLRSERKSKIALSMYLMRLRTGDFLYRLQKTFGLSYETQKKYLNVARESLLLDFVPLHLGFENVTRQTILENSTEMVEQLFDQRNRLILIADASYIFYEKSGNYEIQRNTYSDQKRRNFIKPMIITTPNGYYIDVFGPYKANTNDASILKHVFDNFGPFQQLEANDIFILDRGFIDCKDFLEAKGFEVKMPEFITKTDKTSQLTTAKANASRLVTACRFVIEIRNGNIKEVWKIFNKTWISYEMPNLMYDYKIGAALINAFFRKIESNKGNAIKFSHLMKQHASWTNQFGILYQSDVKHFTEDDADIVSFPLFQPDELKELTLGIYQIKQGMSYIIEHLKKNGKFLIYKCPKYIVLKHFKNLASRQDVEHLQVYLTYMYSRFRKNYKHAIYVLVDSSANGRNGIIGHTCDRRHGLRVVGCCSHISAFISYLGYYRHNRSKIKPIVPFMNDFFFKLI